MTVLKCQTVWRTTWNNNDQWNNGLKWIANEVVLCKCQNIISRLFERRQEEVE